MKIDIERYREIVDLRKSGVSFQEIATRFEITRQRAWQIYIKVIENPGYLDISKDSARLRKGLLGFVYLIGFTELGYYKIGVSYKRTAESRIKRICRSLPFHIDVSHSWKCRDCFGVERFLHRHFYNCRLKNEWYKLSASQLEEAKSIAEKMSVFAP